MAFDSASVKKQSSKRFRFLPNAGKSAGVKVVLDAHSDMVSKRSVYDDAQGFFVSVRLCYAFGVLQTLLARGDCMVTRSLPF